MSRYEPVTDRELVEHTGPSRGATVLAHVVTTIYGAHKVRAEIYNRRMIRGSHGKGWSLHATGRAVDFFSASNDILWEIACVSVALQREIGVAEVIHGRLRWSDAGWRDYTLDPHADHTHIGLTTAFAHAEGDRKMQEALVAVAWMQARLKVRPGR